MAKSGLGGELGSKERIWLLVERSSGKTNYCIVQLEYLWESAKALTMCGFPSSVAMVLRLTNKNGRPALLKSLANILILTSW